MIRPFAAVTLVLAFSLHAGCGGGGPQLKKEDRQKIRETVARYESASWQVRRSAVKELASYKIREVEETLIKALNDSHTLVRTEALDSLEKTENKKARRQIRALAEYEQNNSVRWRAIGVLRGFRDPRDAVVFAKGLSSDDWLLREESVKGLLSIEDFAIKYVSVPYVLQALDDPSINVKVAAIEHLSVRDERIYRALAAMLDDEVTTKHTLLRALLKGLHGYKLDGLTRKRATSLLLHQNAEIRVLALRLLKRDRELVKNDD
ncbi:MAG: HEAT repeat domain-containing protein [Spirochaetes bacterium]|jgi:HEAT repeat protein|nr:HEAT repeat domain-containing protein [Spirochaetota bacterium]